MNIVPPMPTASKGDDSAAPAQDSTERLRDEAARIAAEHHQRSAAQGVADEDADLDLLKHELGGRP